jgi:hypothetical protein
MSIAEKIEVALQNTRDLDSFLQGLLGDVLQWPIDQGVKALEDIGFTWDKEELKALDLDKHVIEGQVWQIQPLPVEKQSWGIFLLQFNSPDIFEKGRGLTGLLRKVLRGLVPNRRKSASLPSWQADNILFICTHNWQHYRFAHFRSADGGKLARLSTFGWGPGTSNRTACEFNLPELAWPHDDADMEGWVKKWTKAFDKEELTKQFYKTFADLYEQVREEIATAPAFKLRALEYGQVLLDRLLFLSFLQRKRWLNNEPDYLYSRFQEHYAKEPDGYSYYRSVLYPLFEAISNRAKRPAAIGTVPFLNGGLFNLELGAADMQLHLKVKNSTFKKIFDNLLNKYNFTVMEDTPLNREVAVDPEMLGKVFETVVLVSDTGGDFQAPDLRKATGSYYTPRIVVHFICREVLLKYLSNRLKGDGWEARIKHLLEIDASDGLDKDELARLQKIMKPEEAAELHKAIERLKCCDPAVGSGAFAVGLLQELLNLTLLCEACEKGKDPRLQKGTNYFYEKKLQIIENSIYGVDIQAKAVDICKLRLWLSLVVDYELDVDPAECTTQRFEEAIAAIPPLPNLAYKIRQGDALLDQINGVPFMLHAVHTTDEMMKTVDALKQEHKSYFKENDPVKKRHMRKTVLGLRLRLSKLQLQKEREVNLTKVQEGLFGEGAESVKKRKWREEEEAKLDKALKEIDQLEARLAGLKSKSRLNLTDEDELNDIESGDEHRMTFSWRLDFPEVFNRIEQAKTTFDGKLNLSGGSGQQTFAETIVVDDGFDIIVGNPPFVTARNKEKRELYRDRWKPYCYKEYHLLIPFFPRAFGIMAADAKLGFIVSNAFAKREFGKPLVEQFFPKVDLDKVVDCSGLMFPGHGTPTCIVFGRNRKPTENGLIRVAAILPGGGDLRTPPEDSPLWATIETHHDERKYSDERVVVADRAREEMGKWPWNVDSTTAPLIRLIEQYKGRLADLIQGYGSIFDTHKDDAYFITADYMRRFGIEREHCAPFVVGDAIRDYTETICDFVIKPYDNDWELLTEDSQKGIFRHLRLFKKELGGRACFNGGSYVDNKEPWYKWHQLSVEKAKTELLIPYPELATHQHFKLRDKGHFYTQTAPLLLLNDDHAEGDHHLLAAFLNSSSALFWLKQVCFNKGAGDAEEKDRFEYAGGKVEQLPVPDVIARASEGKSSHISDRLTKLSQACWERGQLLPSLSMKKLFEKKGEAYDSWNRLLPGYIAPHSVISTPFADLSSLQDTYTRAVSEREFLRSEMIALQEEMDWLVYEAYGLIDKKAGCSMESDALPENLRVDERPFKLWAQAGEDFDTACSLIPGEWTKERRGLWKRRLEAIRDNEHIRRIEQPVYKRRWYQPDSYDKQFNKAFEWWLLEKAEWWLENKKNGGPVTSDEWAAALLKDERVRAAATVAEKGKLTPASFTKLFRTIINSETVPEEIPYAKPWAELEATGIKLPKKVKDIRGKLNVPRERFRLRGKDEYFWAGLEWKVQ